LYCYCASIKLAVEIDGPIHNSNTAKEYDENRSYELEEIGIRILRFSNDQIEKDIEGVLAEIRKYL
jgi:very-short-patch-repair endonuclease